MAATTPKPAALKFAKTVRAELKRKGWGVRTLARTMAAPDRSEEAIERERRNLNRWLSGNHNPTHHHRRRVAKALALKAGALDDDDEEEDALERDLKAVLRKHRRLQDSAPELRV